MQVSASNNSETSRKGLYALAALLRNNADARGQFYSNSGVKLLTKVLKNPDQTQPVQLKILNLITDLSQLDLNHQVRTKFSLHLSLCVDMLCSNNVDCTVQTSLPTPLYVAVIVY